MNQRFRRNFAPVLVALVLLALGLAAWAALGAYRTHDATAALHAQIEVGSSPWDFEPPSTGYAAFVYRKAERVCVTLSLLPDSASLEHGAAPPRRARRENSAALLAEAARFAAGCDTLEVLVFASRMPYHGRFEVHYEGGAVRTVGEPQFGG